MIVSTREGDRLYLKSWEYNACRIFTELRKIAAKKGDIVKPATHTITIINRSEYEEREADAQRLEWIRSRLKEHPNEKLEAAATKLEETLQQPYTEPELQVPAASWIEYKSRGNYIYFQTDENPFFPFYYIKTPIHEDGTRSADSCLDELQKTWLTDDLLQKGASDEAIRKAAAGIYKALADAPASKIIHDVISITVPNKYDDGWHTEKIRKPERRRPLDF